MAYNRVNLYRHYKAIRQATEAHYDPDVTTYKGVWRKYIWPVFHISYSRYMYIIGLSSLEERLEREERAHGRREDPKQGKLF